MSHRVSVIVTGYPSQLRNPEPLPGETKIQMVIRNNRDRWGVCVENIKAKSSMSKEMLARVLDGDLSPISNNAAAQAEVESFANVCLPTSGRTLHDLAIFRDSTKELCRVAEVIEIIWPRERNPAGDQKIESFVKPLGITMAWISTGVSRTFNLGDWLKELHGEFAWLVPAGTTLPMVDAWDRLDRVISHLSTSPKRALYSDNFASFVLRISALRELARGGQTLPSDFKDLGRVLRQAGYELTGDNDPDFALCELEREYGGWSGGPDRPKAGSQSGQQKSLWRKLFGG